MFQAYGEYLDNLTARGRSIRHIDSQEHRLQRFCNDMGENTLVAMIDVKKIEKWIYELKACKFLPDEKADLRTNGKTRKTMQESKEDLSNLTKNNHRTALKAFFEFCHKRGYVSENPINKIEKLKVKPKEPEVFTVSETRRILNLTEANSDLRAYIAIGAFAGLRRAEILRLTWDKIDLSDKTITLSGDITKTSQRRIVDISDNLACWLAPYALKTGTREKIVKEKSFQPNLESFVKRNGIRWKPNALRHSCASYYLALSNNAYKTAEKMGHTVKVLQSNYKGLVKEKAAKEYFNIYPNDSDFIPVENILRKAENS